MHFNGMGPLNICFSIMWAFISLSFHYEKYSNFSFYCTVFFHKSTSQTIRTLHYRPQSTEVMALPATVCSAICSVAENFTLS